MTTTTNPSPFTVREDDLMRSLGLSRSAMREKRAALVRGVDWETSGPSGAVLWSGAVAEKARAEVGGPASEENPASKAEQAAPGPVLLTVAHGPYANTRFIDCFGKGGSATDRTTWVRVAVKSSAHFLPRMELLAEPVAGSATWRFLGSPKGQPGHGRISYPRARGKW